MKILSIFFFLFVQMICLNAQRTFQPKGIEYESKGFVYKDEHIFQFALMNRGFEIGYQRGNLISYDQTRFYHVGVGTWIHPKEYSQNKRNSIIGFDASRAFTYAKRNQLILLRGGAGRKYYKSEKAAQRGVAIGWSYQVGPVFALLRPVKNVYLIENESNIKEPIEITYDEDPALFMNYYRIYGGTSFFENWNKINVQAGIQANAAIHVARGAFEKRVHALEMGVQIDYFVRKLPIMVESEHTKNTPLVMNLFLRFMFGSRG